MRVAERLAAFASDTIKVSRFGGDEFMVYHRPRRGREPSSAGILDDIFAGLQGEVDVAGHALRIQASAGAVLSRVKDTDVDAMIVKADLALYKAKELGKNGWRLFEAAMDAAFRNRQMMKADLRSAIEAKAPARRLPADRGDRDDAHRQLRGALPLGPSRARPDLAGASSFRSPRRWASSPRSARFVLAGATARMRALARADRAFPSTCRPRTSATATSSTRCGEALAESGLAPHRLEIEVTETALLDDKSLTRELIEELKGLGVRIALDDFGTGYSSLSYLHKLPLDKVKIDRSFLIDVTQNQRSLELLTGIVNLSRPLGLTVTVEGVETFEQLKILALKVKPDLVQGFLFGSALSASGIETMSTTVWPFAKDINSAKRAAQR